MALILPHVLVVFSVSNEAMLFIENVQGDFYNIVGLPLNRLFRELKNMGYNIYKL